MPDFFGPLPIPEPTRQGQPQRTGKFIDVEILGGLVVGGVITAGDIVSTNWDGGLDLSGGADGGATQGYFLDASAGAIQVAGKLYADGVELTNLNATQLTSGTMPVDRIAANSIVAGKLNVTTLDAISANLGAVTAGSITTATFVTNSVTGWLTFSGSGGVRTAGSGARVELTNTSTDQVRFFNSSGTVTGQIFAESVGINLRGNLATTTTEGVTLTSSAAAATAQLAVVIRADSATLVQFYDDSSAHTNVQIRPVEDQNVAAPPYSFFGDTDTGMGRIATDAGFLSAGGDAVIRWQVAGANQGTGVRDKGALHVYANDQNLGGTAGNNVIGASFGFDVGDNAGELRVEALRDATGTTYTTAAMGIRRIIDTTGQGSLWFANAGIGINTSGPAKVLHVAGTFALQPGSGSGTNAHLVSLGGSDYELVLDTSILAHKKHVKDVPELADLTLRPISYTRRGTDHKLLGFAADHLEEQDTRLAVYNFDGDLENYSDRGVMAVMAAKINRLERQVRDLTS